MRTARYQRRPRAGWSAPRRAGPWVSTDAHGSSWSSSAKRSRAARAATPSAASSSAAGEADQQAFVEQCPVVASERVELGFAAFGRVVPDQFDPGTADGRVVFLRRTRVSGGALDALADQADRGGHAVPPHRQPRQMDMLPVAEPAAAGHHLGHQRVESGAMAGHAGVVRVHGETSVRACRAVRSPAIVAAGRLPSARRSRPPMACWMVAAASRPEAVSSMRTARRSPGRGPRVM